MRLERNGGMVDWKIESIRLRITEIDDRVAELSAARMKLVAELARYKESRGIPFRDVFREAEILDRAAERVGPDYAEAVRAVFEKLLEEGRNRLESRSPNTR